MEPPLPRAAASFRRPRSDGLPDFIILGAQKGGTTSLQHHLRKHPLIEMSPNLVGRRGTEPHFFTTSYRKGLDWYRSLFNANGLFQGEKSPSYLESHACHALIRQHVPECRLIAILRDPVERAESAFNHCLQARREGRRWDSSWRGWNIDLPFQAGFDDYLAGRCHPGPLEHGRYIDHIESLLRQFPRDQLLVLISEEYRSDPRRTLRQVFEFIGVTDVEVPYRDRVHVRQRDVQIDASARARLREFYKPSNGRLFEFLGREIEQWQ